MSITYKFYTSPCNKIFFGNSGAEANEGAIKLARKYSYDKYGAGRSTVLTLLQSFHGRTITTLKATGEEKFHKYFFPFTEGFDYVKADIVTVAKGLGAGLPIGGIICSSKVCDVFKPGDHGSTFGANPVACAGALVILDELCNEKAFEKITKRGVYVKELLEKANNSQIVDVRGIGLMIGIKVNCDPALVQKEAIKRGLLVLTAGKNVVRLLPPLVISKKELKTGIDIILEILSNIKN